MPEPSTAQQTPSPAAAPAPQASPPSQTPKASAPPKSGLPLTLQILSCAVFTFIVYFSIGVPMAVIPGFVHNNLAFSSVIAGFAISIQYIGTFITRPSAGRVVDSIGARRTVQIGMVGCAASGVLLLLAALLARWPLYSLIAMMIGRMLLGAAESFGSTGATLWGIGRVGQSNNAKVISWNGVATYGALAVGAPLGVLLDGAMGLWSLSILITVVAVGGYFLAQRTPDAAVVVGERMSFFSVFTRVVPHGLGLALGSVGFGSLSTFITLYYASQRWPHAELTLSVFGIMFVSSRLLFSNTIRSYGGFRVAIVSFAVEAVGLLLVWLAWTPHVALIGAGLAGLGFSLIFPALAVEAVALVPPASRGAALSAYSVFLDVAFCITGPIAGLIATHLGYSEIYLVAGLGAIGGGALCVSLYRRGGRGPARKAGGA
ncbi:MFS transporter [Robbsia sp. KACC 23696]|uniref:MFS transporter n=1 Tax=Robbsia sp. KACC 23696 TaxID=3149231 RepID=UPI00325BE7AA